MSLLKDGAIIRDTYEVERLIGEGAFAEVYRVKHRFLGRQAMKVFKQVGMTAAEVENLMGEAALLSRLGHPNIIRVFEANTIAMQQGVFGYFTMEYVAAGSLEQFWCSFDSRFVPVETVVDVGRQICRGMTVAHSEQPPVIHRDIKPQNILVGYDAAGLRVRVSDFGLARHVNPLTMMASGKGTRAFKSPEVYRDWQSDSCTGDVWAIGTILYLLLTDRLPFPEVGEVDGAESDVFDRPLLPPSRFNLQVTAFLDQIVLRSLAPRPEDRYPTAKEMLVDLEKWRPPLTDNLYNNDSTADSKAALGLHTPADEAKARKMTRYAIQLANELNKLEEAADLMEQAFNKWPELRDQYAYRVQLWRRGVIS